MQLECEKPKEQKLIYIANQKPLLDIYEDIVSMPGAQIPSQLLMGNLGLFTQDTLMALHGAIGNSFFKEACQLNRREDILVKYASMEYMNVIDSEALDVFNYHSTLEHEHDVISQSRHCESLYNLYEDWINYSCLHGESFVAQMVEDAMRHHLRYAYPEVLHIFRKQGMASAPSTLELTAHLKHPQVLKVCW
jgi:hypothetical protein